MLQCMSQVPKYIVKPLLLSVCSEQPALRRTAIIAQTVSVTVVMGRDTVSSQETQYFCLAFASPPVLKLLSGRESSVTAPAGRS